MATLLHLDFASPEFAADAAAALVASGASWDPAPAAFHATADGLVVTPPGKTDFWQATHYGFRVHNGPALTITVTGDFLAHTRVRAAPHHQYDQGGLLAVFGERDWLKTSCEYIPAGPSKLGAVVTRGGFSDWSTQPAAVGEDGGLEFELRLARVGGAYFVHSRLSEAQPWVLLRLAHLDPDAATAPCRVGLYACCPLGEGGSCTFSFLHVRRPAEGEVALH